MRQILLAHRLARLEAAGREDDALVGADADRRSVPLRHDADHAPVLDDQLAGRRVEPQRNAAIHQRAAQHADQRIAHGDVAVAPRLETPGQVEPVAAHQLHRQPDPAAGAREQGARLEHRHEDAVHDQHLRVLVAHVEELVAERAGVKALRLDATAARPAAGHVLVIVGVLRQRDEPHLGVLGQVLHHLRRLLEVRSQAILGHGVADRPFDIRPRVFGSILDAGGFHEVIVRHPQTAAGHRRVAAVAVALLDQQRRAAAIVGGERRGHRTGSRADNEKVHRVVPACGAHS